MASNGCVKCGRTKDSGFRLCLVSRVSNELKKFILKLWKSSRTRSGRGRIKDSDHLCKKCLESLGRKFKTPREASNSPGTKNKCSERRRGNLQKERHPRHAFSLRKKNKRQT